jgi:hypothetical protein
MSFWAALRFGKGGTSVAIVGAVAVLLWMIVAFGQGANKVNRLQVEAADRDYDICAEEQAREAGAKGLLGLGDVSRCMD